MKIKDKTVLVYDIESFPNLFTCSILNSENNKLITYEISEDKNDLGKIVALFQLKEFYFCGFNNKSYDDVLINYLIIRFDDLRYKPIFEITWLIKSMSDKIIKEPVANWVDYKHAYLFNSFDLMTMSFSAKNRVGLKELEVTMGFPNVMEYEGDFSKNVPKELKDKVIEYNQNDVLATGGLLNLKKNDIELRLKLNEKYKINVLSKDNVNMGMEILKKEYLEKTNKTWDDIKDLKTPCQLVAFKNIIFDFIQYTTPPLQKLLEKLKKISIDPNNKDFREVFEIGGVVHNISLGGLHSINNAEIIIPNEDELLIDYDVDSFYPSCLIVNNLYPKHLGIEFVDIYKNIRDERVEAKKDKNSFLADAFKYAINGLSGNLQSQYSWTYDPELVVKLRINCQLMILMLIEKFDLLGAEIVQSNTDGILIKIKKSLLPEIEKAKDEWCKLTKLSMSKEEFERFYQYDVNNYIGVKKGFKETKDPELIKKKGFFVDETNLGKGMSPKVIAKSLINYFVYNISPEETLKEDKDIRDYLTYQRVSRDFIVEYNGEKALHINRFYMSINGGILIKYKMEKGGKAQATRLCATSPVTIYNKFEDKPFEEYKVNYRYYKNEIYKIINELEINQLSLF